MSNRWVTVGLTLGALGTVAVAAPREAEAQTTMMDPGRITASPQGLIGGGLLGAELVMLVEGAAGVRNPWIQLGSGAAGLILGGIGGFFVDQAIDGGNDRTMPAISTAMLVVGLGLIIPTAIVFVGSTMYRPDETHTDAENNAAEGGRLDESVGADTTGGSGTAATPPTSSTGTGGGATRGRHRRGLPHVVGPEALLNVTPGHFRVGVPAVSVGSSYTLQEMRQYDLAPQTEWRIPLVTAAF